MRRNVTARYIDEEEIPVLPLLVPYYDITFVPLFFGSSLREVMEVELFFDGALSPGPTQVDAVSLVTFDLCT